MKILETKDYQRFSLITGNRPVNNTHVKKIKESINYNGYLPVAAIVNETNQVIDGQHRLQAVSELGLPYYYTVVKGASVAEAQSLNKTQRQWSIQDYINSYANSGNENYIDLRADMDKWKVSYITAITMAKKGTDSVKNGTLKYKSSQKLDGLIASALEIQPFIGTKVVAVWVAIEKVLTTDGYNHHRMMKNLNAHRGSDKLGARVDTKGYLLMFEDIYNYHAKKITRFY